MYALELSPQILIENKIPAFSYFQFKGKSHQASLLNKQFQNTKYITQYKRVKKLQQKQLKYLDEQEKHNKKYYKWKKLVNVNFFQKNKPIKQQQQNMTNTIENSLDFDRSKKINQLKATIKNQYMTQTKNYFNNQPSNNDFIIASSVRSKSLNKSNKLKSALSKYWLQNDGIIMPQNNVIFNNRKNDKSIYERIKDRSIDTAFSIKRSKTGSIELGKTTQTIKNIIQFSFNSQFPTSARKQLKSLSERRTLNDKYNKKQKKSILDDISKQKLLNFLKQAKCIDPKKKGIYSLNDLKDFQRFQLSFIHYMKLKTKSKIDKYAYQHKVKPKQTNLQKFQQFILHQFPIDNDSKRKLERIFQNIKYEFSMTERRKQVEKR